MKKAILAAGLIFALTAGSIGQVQNVAAAKTETQKNDTADSKTDSETSDTLVAYYSATGNTKKVAETIADVTGGELFELKPTEEYTEEDLDYNNDESRVCKEYADETLRDIKLEEDAVDNWEDINVVYIGYPIWWGIAAWPVDEFVKNNDFEGKTVIPFCTSASSGLGDSGKNLEEMAGSGDWQEGERFSSSVSEEDVKEWVKTLSQSVEE